MVTKERLHPILLPLLGLIAVVSSGSLAYAFYRNRVEAQAAKALSMVDIPQAPRHYAVAITSWRKVHQDYPNTKAGNTALYYTGVYHYRSGAYAQALQAFRNARFPKTHYMWREQMRCMGNTHYMLADYAAALACHKAVRAQETAQWGDRVLTHHTVLATRQIAQCHRKQQQYSAEHAELKMLCDRYASETRHSRAQLSPHEERERRKDQKRKAFLEQTYILQCSTIDVRTGGVEPPRLQGTTPSR